MRRNPAANQKPTRGAVHLMNREIRAPKGEISPFPQASWRRHHDSVKFAPRKRTGHAPSASPRMLSEGRVPSKEFASDQHRVYPMDAASSKWRLLFKKEPASSFMRLLFKKEPASSFMRLLSKKEPASAFKKKPASSLLRLLSKKEPASAFKKEPASSFMRLLDSPTVHWRQQTTNHSQPKTHP